MSQEVKVFNIEAERARFEAYRSRYGRLTRILLWSACLGSMLLVGLCRSAAGGTLIPVFFSSILMAPLIIAGCICMAKSKGYSWSLGLLGLFSWPAVLILALQKDRLRDPRSVSLARLAEDITAKGCTNRELLTRYGLMEETLILLCGHLADQGRISEGDYERVVGRPHHRAS